MTATPRTARERARATFTADLLDAARARLVADGAAGLSLRAVARDLGVASSAVYRYVASRDALLTLLIIEAYDAVGAVCEDAAAAARGRGEPPAQVWLAVGQAFRAWALTNPRSYELIYGTPVPGYAAPQDTVAPATRIWAVIIGIVLDAHADGSLEPVGPGFDAEGLVDPGALEFAAALAAAPGRVTALADRPGWSAWEAVRSFTLFVCLVGAVTAELFGHFHKVTADPARAFDAILATAAAGGGLRVDLGRGSPRRVDDRGTAGPGR
ncbi:TetR/AcrR family transcriptional regulator [Cellulomonas sp. KRMCY2]|uniref:TetR/AcrR family transcriptional regulator n=1 Tax=Cellulomonas sp. KRMCY2 TaxID=1304865 RepID=UPI00045EC286|nr:TetR/AcrR family transcriptional regulator [Cellulomonas sp. KRMCY2]